MERITHNMLNDVIGRLAEMVVALYLSVRGYSLLKWRYKNPHCEVDLVALKEKILLFVEVKFRGSLYAVENTVDYKRIGNIYPASEAFCVDFQKYYHCERLFKLFLVTPSVMRIMTL